MLSVLTPDNIHQIKPLKILGRGEIKAMTWLDEDTLAVTSTAGLWHYTRDGQEREIHRTGEPLAAVEWTNEVHHDHLHAVVTNYVEIQLSRNGEVLILQGHQEEVKKLLFIGDKKLASIDFNHLLLVWDTQTGDIIASYEGVKPDVLAASPDHQTLAMKSVNNEVILWNIETKESVSFPHGHTTTASLYFYGETLVSVSNYEPIMQVWGLPVKIPIIFTPDGKSLLFCKVNLPSWEDEVRLWQEKVLEGQETAIDIFKLNLDTTEETLFLSLMPHDYFHVCADCRRYFRQVANEGLSVFEFETHRLLCTVFVPHNIVTSAMFSPDGRHFFTFSSSKLQIWEMGQEVAQLETVYGSISTFSPDGKYLLVAEDDQILYWNMETQKTDVHLKIDGFLKLIRFSPDGTCFFTMTDETIQLWEGGHETARFKLYYYVTIGFSPDSNFFIAEDEGEIFLWNTRTHQIHGRAALTGRLSGIAFSADGSFFALSYLARDDVEIWNTATVTRIATLTPRKSYGMAFSPKWLALSHGDGTISLWGVENGQ